MTAEHFKKIASSSSNDKNPPTNRKADTLHEKAFWSSIAANPPLYGADTPCSLFDKKLEYGWNLRNLGGCLLSQYDVPSIAGVTTPMTYFGMWKSFFGWHKEDIDLYSVNYLHFGAPKIWYCVSPKHAEKFDCMARSIFPENASACSAFMRHKDIMISPKVLRAHGVPFVQARQEPGEFIVLNAAAYHAGFNLGFNCAEAINFALPEWLDIGKEAVTCNCEALEDGVKLDMGIFFPELRAETSSDDERSESDDDEEELVVRTKARKRKSPPSKTAQRTSLIEDIFSPQNKKKALGPSTPVPEARNPGGVYANRSVPRGAVHREWGKVAEKTPLAVVHKDSYGQIGFVLVHRLDKPSKKGSIWVGLLDKGNDGLYRATEGKRQLVLGNKYPKLVQVRTEWTKGGGRLKPGWRLLTLEHRIMMET